MNSARDEKSVAYGGCSVQIAGTDRMGRAAALLDPPGIPMRTLPHHPRQSLRRAAMPCLAIAMLAAVPASLREQVTETEDGAGYLSRRISPALWPLFFADAQVEIYLPGRDCERCDGLESVP